MLAASTRQVYLETLRPPPGFNLDLAVGTTYSLGLETLLTIPLGFAMLDWEDKRGSLTQDPIALLHALRQCADRVTVFCQAGMIAAPTKHHPLYAYLEPMVVHATAPNPRGQFHAKIWLLRFADRSGAVQYRFICLSRNLTSDRSWDTILTLDGDLKNRTRAFGRNRPLSDFVAALPSLAQNPLDPARRDALNLMADEVLRVDFELPEHFSDFKFWPMGLKGRVEHPIEGRFDRLLVLSPFLSDGFLHEAADGGADTLISRSESLDLVSPEILTRFAHVHILGDGAIEEEHDVEVDGGVITPNARTDARGLHAKLFIADQGWDASVWTGSANATDAAFDRNVEFLVEMLGKRSRVGTDAFLNGVEGGGFSAFLQPFTAGERCVRDPEIEANEELADRARHTLARAGLQLKVERTSDELFDLVLQCRTRETLEKPNVEMSCWPATVSKTTARAIDALWCDGEVRFSGVTVQSLTSFIAFEVLAGVGAKSVSARFTLNLLLDGAPEDRVEQVLYAILSDRQRLLRYLLLLLADSEAIAAIGASLLRDNRDEFGQQTNDVALPLFEELLRALARAPDKLVAIARLIDDLKRTREGQSLLPEGFDEMWSAIWAARVSVAKDETDDKAS